MKPASGHPLPSQSAWQVSPEAGYYTYPPGSRSQEIDPGAGVRWSFAFVLAGEVEDIRRDGRTTFVKGDFCLMKPGARHGWKVPDRGRPWRVVWFVLDPPPEWLPLMNLPEFAPGHVLVRLGGCPEEREVARAFLEAHRHLTALSSPLALRLAANAIECGLLWVNAVATANLSEPGLDLRLSRAMSHVRQNLSSFLTLPDLAHAAQASPSCLLALFKKSLHLTPMEFVERERIQRATGLLTRSGLSIKEIAFACGYSDQRYFSTRYKSVAGISPSSQRSGAAKMAQGGTHLAPRRVASARPPCHSLKTVRL